MNVKFLKNLFWGNESLLMTKFFHLGISAVVATVLHDAIMTPAEVVKQRMQMCCSPYKSCSQATFSIYTSEGLRAFYRSYFTQLTMNVPFQVRISIYHA